MGVFAEEALQLHPESCRKDACIYQALDSFVTFIGRLEEMPH
jgi:hypothetical protein